ncbi:glycosyltransferase family 2 protein [Salegentibacter sp. F188]|uniref:Glycosyltransferase family 2 protein n=1 Tax=Autumnicola patrickiae TaxID=3075591 RepID=A0ABU3DXQ0_9FLAO|nr:glycosyltransferase family 2 protein [Salegentibacter sp. F188]MDT0688505.1 glycosyltransferase family 2 protein [Salegentibacter sp. F188]
MKTAVVILNWNGKHLLEQFLPSVTSHSPEATVYVADNASTDDSVEFLRKNFPQVSIIQNETNGGYAKGYNDALRNLDEDIFILLNSDIEVTPGWLRPIIGIFEHSPKVGAVQPKILDYKNKSYFEYAGAAGGFIDKYAYPFCRGRIFDEIEKDNGQYNDDTTIFWASGACLAIRKEAFLAAGGLDQDFFAHQEEIDLCWRLNNLNYSIRYASKATIYHVGGATLSSINPMKTFFNFRNSLYLIIKNVPSPQVFWVLFMRMILDGLAAFRFLGQGRFNHFFAVFRAHLSFYSSISAMRKKRKNFPKKEQYYKTESVVYAHYLRGRKKFLEL